MEDKLLREAAKEVATHAKIEKRAYEKEAKEQFSDIRGSEDALRTQILRYSSADTIDRLEKELRAAAAGDDVRLLTTIQGLDLGHYPDEQAEKIRELLGKEVEMLSKKGGQSKAYDVLQKLEANDQASEEVAKAVARLPIGTPVTMEWARTKKKMVILAKQPEGRITLKELGSDAAVDQIVLIPEQKIGLRAKPAPVKKAAAKKPAAKKPAAKKPAAQKAASAPAAAAAPPASSGTGYVEEIFNISDTKITINTPRHI
jgi:hypothetical protein